MTPSSDWQRVSPIASVYFFVSGLSGLSKLWPVLLPLFAGGEQLRHWVLMYGVPLALLVLAAQVLLQFWLFTFKVELHRLTIRSGVFKRKRLTLDYDRVQQTDIVRPFYFRPFDLVILGFESAGSVQQEVNLPGLSSASAETLRRLVSEQMAGVTSEVSAAAATAEPQTPPAFKADFLLRLPPAEIIRYGLMHNSMLYLAPLVAAIWQYSPLLGDSLEALGQEHLANAATWLSASVGFSLTLILALAAMVIGTAAVFALSVLLALLRYWGYQLTRVADRFQYRAGLTTIRSRSFKYQKLQKVIIKQGPMACLLRRYTVWISKAGGVIGHRGQDALSFEVPVLDAARLQLLRHELSLPQAKWQRVNPMAFWWPSLVVSVAGFIALLLGYFAYGANGFVGLLLWPLAWLYYWRRWRCFGYYHDDNWLAVGRGLIGFSHSWVPAAKLQKLQVVENPVGRYFGLAQLQLWSADGRLTIAYLPTVVAYRLRDSLLTQVVDYRSAWL